MLERVEVVPFKSLDQVPVTWIDTEDKLRELQGKLEQVEVFAVDLEAHNYRTYCSFCCLMQVSTREEDFLIDTLALRSEMHMLNTSFTNPSIVKVSLGVRHASSCRACHGASRASFERPSRCPPPPPPPTHTHAHTLLLHTCMCSRLKLAPPQPHSHYRDGAARAPPPWP